jgi:2-(3-amino-3-carboxypropyl)histidine synthase
MKIIHVEAKLKSDVMLPSELVALLPEKIIVFTTIQLIDNLPKIISQLESLGKKPFIVKTPHTKHEGQLLGCSIAQYQTYTDKDFDAFLYVGDGLFHPKALLWKNEDKKVFTYDPFSDIFTEIKGQDIDAIKHKNKASLSKFYASTKIGVLVTTKPGQHRLNQSLSLKAQYPDKNFYYFLDNTYNFDSLEDFPFIEVFVNTACPRIGFDDSIRMQKPIVNLDDVLKK